MEGYPVLMSLQLDGGALAQVPSHVCQSLRAALAVSVMSGEGPHQLLSCPLSVLRGQPGGEAASRQGVGQLQGPCGRRTRAKVGTQLGTHPCLDETVRPHPGEGAEDHGCATSPSQNNYLSFPFPLCRSWASVWPPCRPARPPGPGLQ